MGLDIYFHIAKRKRVTETKNRVEELNKALNDEYRKPEGEYNMEKADAIRKELDSINPWKEVAYFRKVNFLIPFFDYQDDCSDIEIAKCQIEDFVDACNEVLADHSKATELLPTTSGFFFGSTEYDNYYFEDVADARDKFQSILDDFTDDDILEMHCWW